MFMNNSGLKIYVAKNSVNCQFSGRHYNETSIYHYMEVQKKHAHESKKLALVGLLINSFMTEISSTVMKSGLIWIYI